MQAEQQVIVVTGGGPLDPFGPTLVVDPGAPVIAADGGLDHAVAAGLHPTHLVGDLDSLSAAGRMWAYAHSVAIDEHPTRKDETDTELALGAAAATDRAHLVVLAGFGDRLDHLLGIVIALGRSALSRFSSVTAMIGSTRIWSVHPGRQIPLGGLVPAGSIFSTMALHGDAVVSIERAEYPIEQVTLQPGSTLGISNITHADTSITCHSGVVTVVAP